MKHYHIRNEKTADHRLVETLVREAFWNRYVPGCAEHYLLHKMREHEDFIPQLDLVLEAEGRIMGSIVYTKTALENELGEKKEILTFGPVAIHPDFQRQGWGKLLIEHSFQKAMELGYEAIVIFGDPGNYVSRGFISCKKHRVCLAPGVFPAALLVKELKPGTLSGHDWQYHPSSVDSLCEDADAVAAFDALFPPKEKAWQPSQEVFYIQSHSAIVR